MAQRPKQKLSGIFSRAEQEYQPDEQQTRPGNQDLDSGKIIAAGVGIKEGEASAFQQLANDFGLTKNAWMRIALRHFLVEVRAGRVNPEDYVETDVKKKPILPQ